MPFTNPIVAGLTLIRQAIRSPNFVTGVSGWSINKDGSAEFNDVTSRGTVVIGNYPSGPYTLISPTVPIEIQNFYTSGTWHAIDFDGIIIEAPDSNSYHYRVVFDSYAGGATPHLKTVAEGWVDGLLSSVKHIRADILSKLSINPGTSSQSVDTLSVNTELDLNAAAFTIDGVTQGRGLLLNERIPAGSVNTGTTVGTFYNVFTTASTITLNPGRACQIKASFQIKSAAAQNPICTIFRDTVAGTHLIEHSRVAVQLTGQDYPVIRDDVVKNATGSPITFNVCIGVTPSVATLVTLDSAAAPSSNYVRAYDVGLASDYPNEQQV